MVSLITQSDFLEDLFILNDNAHTEDLIMFLRHDLFGYTLIVDFNSHEDLFEASVENPLWEYLFDRAEKVIYKSELANILDQNELYDLMGEHNLFLLSEAGATCDYLTEKYGYLYLSIENIPARWDKYKKCRSGIQLKVTNSEIVPESLKMNCWEKLEPFCAPLTSIIIFDKYVLVDNANQKLVDNIFPLLYNLTKAHVKVENIHVSIITELEAKDIESKHKLISNFLKSKGIVNVSLNIIKHVKAFYPRDLEGLHSRFILTNYFHIKSDGSFNFFRSNKKINNDTDIRINFLLTKNNFYFFLKELEDVKKYLSKIKNNENNPKEEYRVLYYPDKSNPLLNNF